MNQDHKTISYLPVDELWEGQKLVSTFRIRDVGSSDIVDLLRSGLVRFVVADIGKPFEWIPNNERFDFWKTEIKTHLVEPESKATLEDYSKEHCYFASEWKSSNDERIILLSKMH